MAESVFPDDLHHERRHCDHDQNDYHASQAVLHRSLLGGFGAGAEELGSIQGGFRQAYELSQSTSIMIGKKMTRINTYPSRK